MKRLAPVLFLCALSMGCRRQSSDVKTASEEPRGTTSPGGCRADLQEPQALSSPETGVFDLKASQCSISHSDQASSQALSAATDR